MLSYIVNLLLAMAGFGVAVLVYHQDTSAAAALTALGVWCAIDAIRAK